MRRRNQQGFVYALALLVVFFLTLLGTSILIRSVSEVESSERFGYQSAALHIADAGVDQAARNLRTPTDLTDDITTGTLPTGTFTLDTPVSLGAQTWKVVSHGASVQEPARNRNIEAVFTLTPQSVFQFALFADLALTAGGSANTDSYDSRLGAYGACLSDCGGGSEVVNVGINGDIGTNGTAAGSVAVSGSLFVDGQIAVGPGVSDPASVVTGYDPAMITGGTSPPSDTQDVVAQSSTFPMPNVTVPDGLTCTDRTVGGSETVTLTAGTYCYRNLIIQGNGTLTASGSAKVYLTGTLNAQGNSSVGVPSDPTMMVFLMTSTSEATLEQGEITGSNKFYGAIYGPQATINITGNAEVYGAIIADRVNLTGSAVIHYDEAVSTLTDVSNLYQTSVVYWQELAGS
ncbi:MAG: hypothetical protein Q8R78_01160 [Candidatus Omnitrophota bacterium]|nr:hypothetical protein [Candidatus Omnitrophota bacterium]